VDRSNAEKMIRARLRMDAMTIHANNDPFAGTELSNDSDNLLSDVWDWCVLDGCRPIVISGRIHMKKGPYNKFRWVKSSLHVDIELMLGIGRDTLSWRGDA
jgi:hypothetical protein